MMYADHFSSSAGQQLQQPLGSRGVALQWPGRKKKSSIVTGTQQFLR